MGVNTFKNEKAPFKWNQFKGEIILWLIRWYCRYALSYADYSLTEFFKADESNKCLMAHE